MRYNISDKDFMIHVLNNLPKEYNNLVKALKPMLGVMNELMVKYLRECLRAKYQHLQQGQKDNTKKETALTTQNRHQQNGEK